jgi:hypothetical protein
MQISLGLRVASSREPARRDLLHELAEGVVGIGMLTLSWRERMVVVEPRGTGMALFTLPRNANSGHPTVLAKPAIKVMPVIGARAARP